MNLSVKNMIFAFVAGLVVFSLLMTALCVGMFNSEISVAKGEDVVAENEVKTISVDGKAIFKVEKSDGSGLSFVVLALIDNSEKKILLTPVYGDYLIPYKNALSYVSSIYAEMGDEMLPEMVKAFSGLPADKKDVYRVDGVVNFEGLKLAVPSLLSKNVDNTKNFSEYTIEDFTLELSDNASDSLKQIDSEKCVLKFRNIIG